MTQPQGPVPCCFPCATGVEAADKEATTHERRYEEWSSALAHRSHSMVTFDRVQPVIDPRVRRTRAKSGWVTPTPRNMYWRIDNDNARVGCHALLLAAMHISVDEPFP
jgi:hypothetical protein